MKEVLKVEGLSKKYRRKNNRREEFYALHNMSFTLYEHEILGIVGESGCGKSTLLKVLSALEAVDQGEVKILGRSLTDWLKHNRLKFRQQLQLIYQNPYEVFDRRQTIEQILEQPLRIHHLGGGRSERRGVIVTALKQMGLEPVEAFLPRYPHELSGGQLQRISILRSLLLQPKIILADEPVSMLDVTIRSEILDIFKRLRDEEGKTIMLVSHDILPLAKLADRLLVMQKGILVEVIPSHKLREEAIHPYTRMLVSNALGKEVAATCLEDVQARPPLDQEELLVEVAPNHWVRKYKKEGISL